MKTRTNSLVSLAKVMIMCVLAVTACPMTAKAEKPDEKFTAIESRVRDLEVRVAKAEARLAEHEKHQAGHATHAAPAGAQAVMPDQPMGMPPQHSMPSQAAPPQGMPMGGNGAGMGDM